MLVLRRFLSAAETDKFFNRSVEQFGPKVWEDSNRCSRTFINDGHNPSKFPVFPLPPLVFNTAHHTNKRNTTVEVKSAKLATASGRRIESNQHCWKRTMSWIHVRVCAMLKLLSSFHYRSHPCRIKQIIRSVRWSYKRILIFATVLATMTQHFASVFTNVSSLF